MRKILVLLLFVMSCSNSTSYKDFDFTTRYESSDFKETATYPEVIEYYKALAATYPEISIDSLGLSDIGQPLHYVTYNSHASGSDFNNLGDDVSILFINNGIHPGESDGIDATMMLYRDLAQKTIDSPENVVIVAIPVYNIGGSLNRNSGTRTNQNGPLAYGFRGNAQNYDLNRDFIKADTKNSRTFAQIFHKINPDVFLDNHVSNGADYQYTLTHLFTQHNKLGGPMGDYLNSTFISNLEVDLKRDGWDITPYVNVFNRVPESGFSQFMDYPRYSTGYTTLFNTLGVMLETHMLKPYQQRVEGSYQFMNSLIEIMDNNVTVNSLKQVQYEYWQDVEYYPIQWELDTTKTSTLEFKGYEGNYINSKITGGQRLKYDVTKPFTKSVAYSNYYRATDSVKIPNAYVVPKGWHRVIDRLKENNIALRPFDHDTIIKVERYKIASYESRNAPYEGHYLHYNTKVTTQVMDMKFTKGDYVVATTQPGLRYLLETLEPSAIDSFFNWNYFDTILQQKEGFSPYVWEDKAADLLRANPQLQIEFNLKKTFDKAFANNWYAQLDWLHKRSPNYESAHMTYPIFRITE